MGVDGSKSTSTRKRSGIANVFAASGCQYSAGDTKAARDTSSTTPTVSESSEVPLRAIPKSPKNCQPGRVRPSQADASITFMAAMEYVHTVRLLDEGLPPVAEPSRRARKVPACPLSTTQASENASAVPASGEIVSLPAYRSTGLPMLATAETHAMLGTTASSAVRRKECMEEKTSSTPRLTVATASATESPRVTCEELIDEPCSHKGSKDALAAAPETAGVASPSQDPAHQGDEQPQEPPGEGKQAQRAQTVQSPAHASATAHAVNRDGQALTEAVVGEVYFDALRAGWSARPPPHSAADSRVQKLPSLAAPSEVGEPADILHIVTHPSSNYPLFKKPIPLGYMIEILKPVWEDDGLYEQVEEQERYAQIEAARRAKHRRQA